MEKGAQVLGVILAGGQSLRMGGEDKACLEIGGKTLARIAFDRLSPQVDPIIIAGPKSFGLPVPAVPDLKGPLKGPLAGLLAATFWGRENRPDFDWIVSVPVDSPFFPENLVKRLVPGAPSFAVTKKRQHPVFAAWPTELSGPLENYRKQSQNPSLWGFLKALGASPVFFPEEGTFFNINTPKDLELGRLIMAKT